MHLYIIGRGRSAIIESKDRPLGASLGGSDTLRERGNKSGQPAIGFML
jgi:hypothetical protein